MLHMTCSYNSLFSLRHFAGSRLLHYRVEKSAAAAVWPQGLTRFQGSLNTGKATSPSAGLVPCPSASVFLFPCPFRVCPLRARCVGVCLLLPFLCVPVLGSRLSNLSSHLHFHLVIIPLLILIFTSCARTPPCQRQGVCVRNVWTDEKLCSWLIIYYILYYIILY